MKVKQFLHQTCLFSASLLLSACGALPKHDSTLNDDSKIIFAQQQFSLQGENKLQSRWWLALNDATLNKIIARALKNNFNLKSGLLKIQKARLSVKSTQAEQAFKLNATSSIGNTSSKTSTTSTDVNNLSVGLTASYELDLWNKLSQQETSAKLSVNTSALDDATLRLSISAEIATAWYRLLEKRQQLDLLNQQLTISQGYLQLLEQQFRSGQALAADVIQQKQTVESVIGDRFTTLKDIETFKRQLALLMATPNFDVPIKQNSQLPKLPALPKIGLKATVINNRPDVQNTYNNLAIADTAIAISVANRYPSISLSASYKRQGDSLSHIFDNWASSLTANLLLPIIDGDTKKLAVKKNQLTYQQSVLSYKNTVLNAVKEVEDALNNERYQQQYTQSLQKQITLSAQATKQIRDSYINGAVNFQRVLNAVLSDQNTQRTYLRAKRQLIEYRINLYRALSGGWLTPNKATKELNSEK